MKLTWKILNPHTGDEIEEDAPSNNTANVAGAGDDSSTVVVKKKNASRKISRISKKIKNLKN